MRTRRPTLLQRLQLLLLVLAVARVALGALAPPGDACSPTLGGECCEAGEPCGDPTCPDDHAGDDHAGDQERTGCKPGCTDTHCCPPALLAIVSTGARAMAPAPVTRGTLPPEPSPCEGSVNRIDRPPRTC